MKVYTRQGDKGSTCLADGIKVDKDNLRVESYGYIDELNSQIGLLICEISPQEINLLADLQLLQHELFDLGSELAFSSAAQNKSIWRVSGSWTTRLEQQIDAYTAHLTPLKKFILPGGSRATAQAHVVRTLVRHCERLVLALSREESINPEVLPYLNRMSDWFFTIARYLLCRAGISEVVWLKASER